MKSIFRGLLIALLGVAIIASIVVCGYVFIFVIPTLFGYESIILVLLTSILFATSILYLWCLGQLCYERNDEEGSDYELH